MLRMLLIKLREMLAQVFQVPCDNLIIFYNLVVVVTIYRILLLCWHIVYQIMLVTGMIPVLWWLTILHPWISVPVFNLLGLEKCCKEFLVRPLLLVMHLDLEDMWHSSVMFWPSFEVWMEQFMQCRSYLMSNVILAGNCCLLIMWTAWLLCGMLLLWLHCSRFLVSTYRDYTTLPLLDGCKELFSREGGCYPGWSLVYDVVCCCCASSHLFLKNSM